MHGLVWTTRGYYAIPALLTQYIITAYWWFYSFFISYTIDARSVAIQRKYLGYVLDDITHYHNATIPGGRSNSRRVQLRS